MNLIKTTALGLILALGLIIPQAHAAAAFNGDQFDAEDADRLAIMQATAQHAVTRCIEETATKISQTLTESSRVRDNLATTSRKVQRVLDESKLAYNACDNAGAFQRMILILRDNKGVNIEDTLGLAAPRDNDTLIQHFYRAEEELAAEFLNFGAGRGARAALRVDGAQDNGIDALLQQLGQRLEENPAGLNPEALEDIAARAGQLFQQLTDQKTELEERLEQTRANFALYRDRAAQNLHRQREEITQQYRQLQTAYTDLEQAAQRDMAEIRRTLAETRQGLERAQQEREQAQQELAQARRDLQAAAAAAQPPVNADAQGLAAQLRQAQARIEELQTQTARLRDQALNAAPAPVDPELQAANAALQARVRDLEGELVQLDADIDENLDYRVGLNELFAKLRTDAADPDLNLTVDDILARLPGAENR